MKKKDAIAAINRQGILLVYPIKNAKDPTSLWSVAYPRSEMRWDWDAGGDNRVASLWHLREELSRSGEVIYAKWYQGRATFFSKKLFTALRAQFQRHPLPLNREARELLALMQESSPQSTRQLKRGTQLIGRALESTYERGMKQLWQQLLIAGYGEVDEGSFPSLAVGASSLLFEELEQRAKDLSDEEAAATIAAHFPAGTKFQKFYLKVTAPPKL
ncbi:MAG: hypothetical protein EOP11_02915 [Proteobacteria bacterium]|nr:MAG: hypothetical protein EOP11_02915 [Pseudomonadota bacterium]